MTRSILIAIHVQGDGASIERTLESLATNTPRDHRVVIVVDAPDAPTRTALDRIDVVQVVAPIPVGGAGAFNLAAAFDDSALVVFTECGAIFGSRWLDEIVAALDADPSHGLAGPSTNRSWNEQGVRPQCPGNGADVDEVAEDLRRRQADPWKILTPLLSLADFCYAVRRDVIDAIGPADEGYGLGPCWEMDYNVRAARAGFVGVWACRSFVWRSPCSPRRAIAERRWFESAKRLYQDKFCGRRLRGEKTDYANHCRGEDCPDFAPRERIGTASVTAVTFVREAPLASCVMPTRGRPAFVEQSLRYFFRQTGVPAELIVVGDAVEDFGRRIDDPRVRYECVAPGTSIGEKRNRACSIARGEFIVQWDDDDWYASQRLERQLAPLVSESADVSGLHTDVFFDLDRWEFWRAEPALLRRMFATEIHGGTLAFRKSVWDRQARYPDASLAEDAAFLMRAQQRGARLAKLDNRDSFVYVRHGSNTWRFECGSRLGGHGWTKVEEPHYLTADRAFYAARSSAPGPARCGGATVSCIMPTADRRAFVRLALQWFSRQDYRELELIVLDDGHDPVADLVACEPRARYERIARGLTLGAKRNAACEAASGDIIVHWDDDDWYAPRRVSYQVRELERAGADVCGVDRVVYWRPATGDAWQYRYPPHAKPWVAGNSLCYTREFWRRNPFPEIDVGEDARFLWSGVEKRIAALENTEFMVGVIHASNVSPKVTHGERWQRGSVDDVARIMGTDVASYSQCDRSVHVR